MREFEEDGPCLPDSNSGTVVRIQGFPDNQQKRTTTLAGNAMRLGTSVCSFRKAALKSVP